MPTLDGIMSGGGGRGSSAGDDGNTGDSSSPMNGGSSASIGRPSFNSFRQASSNAFSKAQLMVGLKSEADLMEEGEQQGNAAGGGGGGDGDSRSERSGSSRFIDEAADLLCPELTYQQRLIGFASCFTLGYLITFMSFKFFIQLMELNPVPFAMNYTAGNILALSASWFLCGPKRQFRNMFDDKRKYTSIVYLSCLGGTLGIVFIPLPWAIKLLTLLLLIVTQCCASFWYSLSYVPYGRRTVTRILKRWLGMNDSSPIEGWTGIPGLTRGASGDGGEGN